MRTQRDREAAFGKTADINRVFIVSNDAYIT